MLKEHPCYAEDFEHCCSGVAEKPQVLTLSEEYLRNDGRVAQRQATQRVYRLTGVWKECLWNKQIRRPPSVLSEACSLFFVRDNSL
jgi:hypothetical protein